ncbi:MAG: hypothetical protein JW971_05020 [Synergistales bacterium]|nr:hypothetical protein [Synergistales bacterium]
MKIMGPVIQVDIIAKWMFIFILLFCILTTVISLISLKGESRAWWKLAILCIELLLAASSLYLFFFIKWWIAIAPVLPFVIVLLLFFFAQRKSS